MQLKLIGAILSFFFLITNSIAQNNPHFFKVTQELVGDEPLWIIAMYAENPNVFEVVDLYHAYYSIHTFEKNIHTQNYKYWLRATSEYVQADGTLIVPTPEIERERIARLHNQHHYTLETRTTTCWINIGPDRTYMNNGSENTRPIQVNVFSMGVSPSNNDIMYGAAEGGGIFKSIDHGLNWELTSKNEVFTNAQDIKVHSTNSDIVYVASGNDIYKTEDGGIIWTLNFSTTNRVEQFYIHRTNPSKVYAATADGLYLTENDGDSWSVIFDKRCWDIEAHAINPDILFLSTHNAAEKKAEIFKSTDAGLTWILKDTDWYIPTDLSEASDIGCKIGVTPANPDRIYACLIGDSKSGDNGWIGVYYSDNGADSWINADGIDGGPYELGMDVTTNWYVAGYSDGYHQGWYNFDMDVSHTDADKIWIGTIWFCESSNKGENIEFIRGTRSLEMHSDVQDIDVVNGELWVTSDGGINFSTDECLSVEVRNTGISASTFWGFNQGWNEDTWTGGRYHNGNAVYHENFGFGNTMFMGGAETSTGYINPIDNRETHYSDISDKYTPDNLSESAGSANNYSIYPNESYWLLNSSEVEYDFRYANHLYLGNENVFYKSTDGGASFEAKFEFPDFSRVLQFEISRDNPNTIYCLVRNGALTKLYKSTNQGDDFEIVSELPSGSSSHLDLTINPSDENELWVAYHYGPNGEKVYATNDGGTTWTNKTTTNLNGHRIVDIVFQAGTDHLVYVVSNYGIFYWDQPTNEWIAYSEDLPFITRALYFRPFYRDHKLRLSGGRGIWEAALAKPSLPIAQPMTNSDIVYCNRDTVQFDCYSVLAHEGASWEWDFSPAPAYVSSLTDRNPKVVFTTEGSYDVTLTITDADGNTDSKTVENMVTLDNQCAPDLVPGLAMECFATGDYTSTPNLNIGETNHFTVSAWVKPNGIQPAYTGIVFNDGASAGLNFREDNQLAYHWPSGAWWWDSGLFVEADVWSHVAMVVTPDSITVYLNGIASTDVFAVATASIETMKIGSYKGWGSRNYKGLVDEVCIWNKNLSENEIRELRHLTRTGEIPYTDNLISYYQFNIEGITAVNDRIGTNHAVLNAGAIKVVSTAPVGNGNSDRLTISSGGTVSFPNSETEIVFADDTDYLGEIVVTRILLEPDSLPSAGLHANNYWIINNYGEETFTNLEEISFIVEDATPLGLPEDVFLFVRNENEDLNNWIEKCSASTFEDTKIIFGTDCEISNFSQFFIEGHIVDDEIIAAIPKIKEDNSILIYPNPSSGVFYVNFENYQTLEIEITDNLGKLLYNNTLSKSGSIVDLSSFATGIYFINFKVDNTIVKSEKWIKQ